VARESTTRTRSASNSSAPIRAALNVPERSEEIVMHTTSIPASIPARKASANLEEDGCEVFGRSRSCRNRSRNCGGVMVTPSSKDSDPIVTVRGTTVMSCCFLSVTGMSLVESVTTMTLRALLTQSLLHRDTENVRTNMGIDNGPELGDPDLPIRCDGREVCREVPGLVRRGVVQDHDLLGDSDLVCERLERLDRLAARPGALEWDDLSLVNAEQGTELEQRPDKLGRLADAATTTEMLQGFDEE